MVFDPLSGLTGRPLVFLITFAASCGFVLFGYDNGVFSGLIISPWFLKTFHHPGASLLGTVSATYNLGGFLGSLIAFFFGNAVGRPRAILIGTVICTIGAIIQSASKNLGELISSRIICGVGVGVMTSTVGLWEAETVSAGSRGRYLCAQILFGAAGGLFLAQWINYGFYQNAGRVAFAFPVAFQLVFLVSSGTLVMFLPESPRWLVKKGRIDEAREILLRLQPGIDVEPRLQQIVQADTLEKGVNQNQYTALVVRGSTQNLRRVCLACGVMIMHQLNGINSVTYYMPTLLETFLGASHKTALWVAGLTSLTSIIFATIPVLTIDTFGRRPFLWGGAIWQSITFSIIAALLAHTPEHGEAKHQFGVVVVVMFFLYYGGNAATWLGPSWAYPAEILPLEIREKGLALGNVCYWLFQFMIVEVTPSAIKDIKYKYYVIFAVLNIVNAAIIFFLYPETNKMSLEEIDFHFAERYGDGESKAVQGETELETKHGNTEHSEVAEV